MRRLQESQWRRKVEAARRSRRGHRHQGRFRVDFMMTKIEGSGRLTGRPDTPRGCAWFAVILSWASGKAPPREPDPRLRRIDRRALIRAGSRRRWRPMLRREVPAGIIPDHPQPWVRHTVCWTRQDERRAPIPGLVRRRTARVICLGPVDRLRDLSASELRVPLGAKAGLSVSRCTRSSTAGSARASSGVDGSSPDRTNCKRFLTGRPGSGLCVYRQSLSKC